MKSRMTRECHVRICEGLGVKFPGATRPGLSSEAPPSSCQIQQQARFGVTTQEATTSEGDLVRVRQNQVRVK
jgi:hypothetical protein